MGKDTSFLFKKQIFLEFGHTAKMSQLIRKSVSSLLAQAKDGRVSSRLAQTLSGVKNLDMDSVRGERKVAIGLQSDEGKRLLQGFNFNNRASFDSVFRGDYALDAETGTVTLADFNPATHLAIPGGGTHVRLSVAMSRVDFETAVYQTTYSDKLTLALTDEVTTQTLAPLSVPTGNGVQLFYFLLEFFQELNGTQYPLRNNAHNVLFLMEVL